MPQRRRSYESRLVESIATDLLDSADTAAADQGPPPDADAPSERRKAALFWKRDPSANFDQIREALLTTGLAPEQMQQLAIGKLRPKLLAAYAQPLPDVPDREDLATRYAVLAEHPYRLDLLEPLTPRERVREAARLRRAEPMPPMTPDPLSEGG